MRIGECFILGFHGYELPNWIRDFENKFGLGGVILFDYYCQTKKYEMNVETPEQLKKLTAQVHSLASRPLVVIDQEGGKVRRLKESRGFAPLRSQWTFSQAPREVREAEARVSYREMRALGVDMNLAPVVDLNSNPENPNIGKVERSFSADPRVVRENVELLAKVAREEGMMLCLKHYPGLGGASVNSHDEFTDLSQCHSAQEEEIFYDLAPTIPGEAVLVGHGVIHDWESGVPISVSAAGIGRLRGCLPEALILSDDLQMQGLQFKYGSLEASRLGLSAGLDLVLVGNNMLNKEEECFGYAESLTKNLERDALLRERVSSAIARVARRKS